MQTGETNEFLMNRLNDSSLNFVAVEMKFDSSHIRHGERNLAVVAHSIVL